jgi:tetratricopeptide (TPR) repeat protein
VLLQQGTLYRDMGSTTMALAKFYEVMTSALNLKIDRLKEYQQVVLQAKIEIADTYFQESKYADAAGYYQRLLEAEAPAPSKKQIHFKLLRSLLYLNRSAEAATQAQDFLNRYARQAEEPEVRFLLASALKQQGRNRDSLQQVLLLLETQSRAAESQPANWVYWQQRTGNEIANQLYKEGDYVNALEIYLHLAQLDASAQWQMPVWYQASLTYERLSQPQKAIETYNRILSREKELGSQAPPGLRTVIEMAKWRKDFLMWTVQADQASSKFKLTAPAAASTPLPP